MERGTRKCIVCGKAHVYCPTCGKGNPKETWRYLYDDESCRNIFNITADFQNGHIEKTVAKEKLQKELTGKTLRPEYQAIVDAITAPDPGERL